MSGISCCFSDLRVPLDLMSISMPQGACPTMARSWFLAFSFIFLCVTGPTSGYAQIFRVDYGSKKTSGQIKNGQVTATIEHQRRINSDGSNVVQPVVNLQVGGLAVGSISTPEVRSPHSILQVVELDLSNPYPEVLLSTFTGGAHCCSDTRVLTSDSSGKNWIEVSLGVFDGVPAPATDPIKGGEYVIVSDDNRFIGKFGSYADSWRPARIWRLQGNAFIDVTHKPEYLPIHRASLNRMASWFSRSHVDYPNGFLAAYVANKSLVGELFDGWDRMLLRYDSTDLSSLTKCQAGYDDKGNCKAKEIVYDSYPQALRAFLIETGYLSESGR